MGAGIGPRSPRRPETTARARGPGRRRAADPRRACPGVSRSMRTIGSSSIGTCSGGWRCRMARSPSSASFAPASSSSSEPSTTTGWPRVPRSDGCTASAPVARSSSTRRSMMSARVGWSTFWITIADGRTRDGASSAPAPVASDVERPCAHLGLNTQCRRAPAGSSRRTSSANAPVTTTISSASRAAEHVDLPRQQAAVAPRQQRLGRAHARRRPRGEDERGDAHDGAPSRRHVSIASRTAAAARTEQWIFDFGSPPTASA